MSLSNPEDFEIVCDNDIKMSFLKENERAIRSYYPYYYFNVDVPYIGHQTRELYSSRLMDFGEIDLTDRKVKFYYPYDVPAFVSLLWYNDTYSGVIQLRAVEKAGWLEFEFYNRNVPYPDNDYGLNKYLLTPDTDLDLNTHTKRKFCCEVDSDIYFTLKKVYLEIRNKKWQDITEDDKKVLNAYFFLSDQKGL